jgi:transposase-like protein
MIQSGMDASTLTDVFNYTGYPQLVSIFGSEDPSTWDTAKCPARIDLLRPKSSHRFYSFLDVDAIDALRDWLEVRGPLKVFPPKTPNELRRSEPIYVNRYGQALVVVQAVSVQNCPSCGSASVVKHGLRHNQYRDLQRLTCRGCGKRFVVNLGFDKMKATPQAITGAMQLYFTGESFRNVQKFLRLQGVNVSHVAVHAWVKKYVGLMQGYLDKLTPQVGETWRTDELFLKVKGNMKYLFAMMDDDTRFWKAQQVADHKATSDIRPMFEEAQERAGKNPRCSSAMERRTSRPRPSRHGGLRGRKAESPMSPTSG